MTRASRWLVVGVMVGAAAVRLAGIGFGLPFPYAAVDERIVTDRVAGLLHGDLDPHYFAYPSLCFELHGVVGWFRFVAGAVPRGVLARSGNPAAAVALAHGPDRRRDGVGGGADRGGARARPVAIVARDAADGGGRRRARGGDLLPPHLQFAHDHRRH